MISQRPTPQITRFYRQKFIVSCDITLGSEVQLINLRILGYPLKEKMELLTDDE